MSLDIPFRLFDCFGFTAPVSFFPPTVDLSATFFGPLAFRLGGADLGGGSGAGLITGDDKKTEGDGIVMVSIAQTASGYAPVSSVCLEYWRTPSASSVKFRGLNRRTPDVAMEEDTRVGGDCMHRHLIGGRFRWRLQRPGSTSPPPVPDRLRDRLT